MFAPSSGTLTIEGVQFLHLDHPAVAPQIPEKARGPSPSPERLFEMPSAREGPTAILVIDDSPDVRALLREALTKEGYQVLEAANGHEGVRLFKETWPDLVLVDIFMPEMDGIMTVREILAFDPAAIIFTMSGKDDAEDHNEVARMMGAKRGFRKPVGVSELIAWIGEALGAG